MNIVIDCRPLLGGRLSGVEIYTLNLIKHLLKNDRSNRYVLFSNSARKDYANLERFASDTVKILHTSVPNRIFNLSLLLLGYPKLDMLIRKRIPDFKPDIFFQPDLRPLSLSKGIKKICVVHDLSFHHYPHFFSLKTRLWHLLIDAKKKLARYDRIIAVSEATRKDLVSTFRLDEKKISVIHEGIEQNFCSNISPVASSKVKIKYGLPENYFLFLSTHEPRKNLKNLIKAFIEFKRQNQSDLKLVLVGGKNDRIFAKTELSVSDELIFTGFIPEEDKPYLFKNAKAFLYPSIFEGFGLPLLEAMKCGTPVITSNTSSMPEICGKAALYANPSSIEEITCAMRNIIDQSVRERLIKEMEERIKIFSWKKCAEETLALFHSTLSGKRNP